ncbi:deSI-like protein [Hordeum vulgare]|uniref:deSI-like protein At4g17486 n=1 Tax=Hordeum vulgare subsp. vulgare TaxID=112509 RepID=UPI000B466B30|nr:deSI-like protein At4g17486 [Hordeum vulgare subsp. vulgare]KAE8778460.1 deSI-like protein [Hordeum vulgare]
MAAAASSSSSSTSSSAGSSASTSTPRPAARQAAPSSSPVFLNVYDVTPANGYARWLGLGVYHSGVQVHGVEYAYGAHEGAGSGIFEVSPRRCPGYAFREAVLVGTTELTRADVRALMADLAADFPGDAYNLVSRNCNHFCDAACRRLVARARIPRWVNRLAKIGVVFTCVIPSTNQVRRKGDQLPPVKSRSARQPAAPPRPRTFFRSLSVGGGGKNVTPRPLQTPPPTPPTPQTLTTPTPTPLASM